MPKYRVEALEKFIVRTVYYVEADHPKLAEAKCQNGDVGYDSKEIEEGDEQWIETVSVEEVEDDHPDSDVAEGDIVVDGVVYTPTDQHHLNADYIVRDGVYYIPLIT